jgi:hypothetical protein
MRTSLPILAAAAAGLVMAGPAAARTPLVAVGDADMAPTAYVNNRLDPRVPGDSDRLLTVDPATGAVRSAPASNAVTGPSLAVDKSPDGRYAVVVETHRPAAPGATRFNQLEPGREVALVRLRGSRPPRPLVLDRAAVPTEPAAASVSPDGRHVLVATKDAQRPVTLLELVRGRFGARYDLPLAAGPAVNAAWRPDGKRFAVTFEGRDEVLFYAFDSRGGRPRVRLVGGPVKLESRVFGGFYTPDGRTFITNNVPSNPVPEPGTQPDPESFLGWLSVLDVSSDAPRVVQTVRTPIIDEGLAISADGRRVATVNLQTTALEPSHPLYSPLSTISLWAFDPAAQRLTKLGDTEFEGVLPEGIDFDPAGRRLAVTTYQRNWADLPNEGSVDIWRLDADRTRPVLERRVRTMRGVHSIAWAR